MTISLACVHSDTLVICQMSIPDYFARSVTRQVAEDIPWHSMTSVAKCQCLHATRTYGYIYLSFADYVTNCHHLVNKAIQALPQKKKKKIRNCNN